MTLNKVQLIGNLTRDPETRTTTSGQSVTSFGMATNRSWMDASGVRQEKAEFHSVIVWGKLGEICQQYLAKGRKAYVEGRLQTREWEDKSGVKKTKTEIVVENMIMLDRAPNQRDTGEAFKSDKQSGTEEDIKVEEIPF